MDEKIPYTPENTQPTPAYEPTTPAYEPTAPAYEPATPAYEPTAPAYEPTAPVYQPVADNQAPYYPQPPYNGAPVYSPAPQPVKPEKKLFKIFGLISFILGFSCIGLSILAFVFGFAGSDLSWLPYLCFGFAGLSAAGIVLGILGMKNRSGKGKAITGMICNIAATFLAILFAVLWVAFIEEEMYGSSYSSYDFYDYLDDYDDYDYDDYYDYDYDDYDYDYDYDYDDYYDYDYSYDSYDSYDYDSDYNFCAASGCLNRAYSGDYCLDHNYLE